MLGGGGNLAREHERALDVVEVQEGLLCAGFAHWDFIPAGCAKSFSGI